METICIGYNRSYIAFALNIFVSVLVFINAFSIANSITKIIWPKNKYIIRIFPSLSTIIYVDIIFIYINSYFMNDTYIYKIILTVQYTLLTFSIIFSIFISYFYRYRYLFCRENSLC